jgi:DNA-binding response OmpR family regulator
MSGLTMMLFDEGTEHNMRCRFISEWFKIDSYIYTKEKLLSEIERNRPDVVMLDLNLYAKIDGIETSRMIRSQFDVPVIYV